MREEEPVVESESRKRFHPELPRGRERFLGWSGALTVAAVLVLMSVFSGAAAGVGFSAKIGDTHVTFGVGVGNRDAMGNALPWYAKNQIGQDGPYVNQSVLVKFGIFEVVEVLAVDNKLQIPDWAADFKLSGR